MPDDYIEALGVRVNGTVIDYNKDPHFSARSTLTIRCDCGKKLKTQPMIVINHGRKCNICKRRYTGEHVLRA